MVSASREFEPSSEQVRLGCEAAAERERARERARERESERAGDARPRSLGRRRGDDVVGHRVRHAAGSGHGPHARAALRQHMTNNDPTALPGQGPRRGTADAPTQSRTSSATAAPSRPCRASIPTPRPHIHLPRQSTRIDTRSDDRKAPTGRELHSCPK